MTRHRVPLIEGLLQPQAYPHTVHSPELVETHISWLLLAGAFAYKIKKPVDLGFADFSSLDKRKYFCQEELRLNRRFSPELYLEVAAICGTPDRPRIGGDGPAIEYAVKMVRFPADARLDRVAARGELTVAHCDRLARTIAEAHQCAAVAAIDGPFGQPDRIERQTTETLTLADQNLPATEQVRLAAIRSFAEAEFTRIASRLAQRRAEGLVRECHGDLHLENMLLADDKVCLFDCLEFNPSLRWIDVMSDIAFATMDLVDRGQARLAARLLNRYLELTGDYAGLEVLAYYQVYRATVRAAVAGVRLRSADLSADDRVRIERKADAYLRLAHAYTQPNRPLMLVTHGLSGSGKSTFTEPLLEMLPAVRLRSDVERTRLETTAEFSGREDRYSPATRRRVYEAMAATANLIIAAGYSVILDATFLKRGDRQLMADIAAQQGIPFVILRFDANDEALRKRIEARLRIEEDVSEATAALIEQQQREFEALEPDEIASSTLIEATGREAADVAAEISRIR